MYLTHLNFTCWFP